MDIVQHNGNIMAVCGKDASVTPIPLKKEDIRTYIIRPNKFFEWLCEENDWTFQHGDELGEDLYHAGVTYAGSVETAILWIFHLERQGFFRLAGARCKVISPAILALTPDQQLLSQTDLALLEKQKVWLTSFHNRLSKPDSGKLELNVILKSIQVNLAQNYPIGDLLPHPITITYDLRRQKPCVQVGSKVISAFAEHEDNFTIFLCLAARRKKGVNGGFIQSSELELSPKDREIENIRRYLKQVPELKGIAGRSLIMSNREQGKALMFQPANITLHDSLLDYAPSSQDTEAYDQNYRRFQRALKEIDFS